MAKIEDIKLISAVTGLSVKSLPVKISVCTFLSFHPLDLKGQMEYQLHLFIVHACTDLSTLKINYNWDEAEEYPNDGGRNDILIHLKVAVIASEIEAATKTIWTTVDLEKLPICGIKVLGKLVPAISVATKWSNNYIFNLQFK